MSEISRRRLLGSGIGVLGAAAIGSVLPPNLRRALAAPTKPGSLADIEHVVILMQENRSFDHYFGTLSGVRGFNDPDAIKLSTGRSVFYQPDPMNPDGYLLPFHLDTTKTSAQAVPSTSHAYSVQHAAWNNGKMDNWVPAHRAADGNNVGPYTMGYYTRADIPFQFALAEAFTLCDAYHCSVLGPTWPNRMYLWTGMIDPEGKNGGPITSNVVPKPYTWTTYPERLTKAGVSWHVYQEEDNYGCNPLELFQQYQDADVSSPLYQHALTIGPADQFEQDALNDRLPTVSWIVPTARQCEHPSYLPAAGADFVASKLDAIAANPEVWNKTLFILNYDENDGLFDHVAPPTPPPGTRDEFVDGLPIGAGIRVPCFLISPFTQGGIVASEPFDHTSILRFLEVFTGVKESNITDWRRKTFGDLTSALGVRRNGVFPVLPPTKQQLDRAEYEVATYPPAPFPGADQTPPKQETSRPTTSTPPAALVPPETVYQGPRPGSVSRVTETLTSHADDFPGGVANTNFPGIAVAAANASPAKSAGTSAYIAEITNDAVAVINTGTHTLLKSISVGTGPYGVAATPDGSRILITNCGTTTVSVLDPVKGAVTATLSVGLYPQGIVVTPDGKHAYVANTGSDTGSGGSSTLSVLDLGDQKVTGEITVGVAPLSLAVSPDGNTVYATCYDNLSVVDTGSGESRATVPGQAKATGLAVTPDGKHLYVVNSWKDTVSVLDTVTNQVVATIPVGKTPWKVAFRPDGAQAYVTNTNEDTVSVLDTGSLKVINKVKVDHGPTAVRATADTVWISNNSSSTVTALSATTGQIVGKVDLGLTAQPSEIAVV
jgi:phospholipase C